jgi:hypothetical protein
MGAAGLTSFPPLCGWGARLLGYSLGICEINLVLVRSNAAGNSF